jgi:hypothetical protein
VWRGENGLTSSRRWIAAGAWLLAAGLLVVASGATAFADTGSDASKAADSSSAAKDHATRSGSGTGFAASTAGGGEAHSTHDDAGTPLGVSQQPAVRSGAERTDTVTKPTTQITRTVPGAVDARQVSADIAPATDSASESDAAPTNDETAPTSDPTPPTDTAPTGEVTSPPTTNELQPSPTDTPPTDDPSPPADDASTEANDASESGSDQNPSSSDTSSSDTTAVFSAPDPVQQDTTQGVSSSSDTASSPNETAPIPDPAAAAPPDVTTVLEEMLTPTTEAVAPPPVDLPALPATTVTEDQLVTDDVSTRNRSDARGGPELSAMQILRLLTQSSGSSFAGTASEIRTLLDGSNQMRSDSTASAFGLTGVLAGTSPTSVATRVDPDAALPEGLQTFLHSYGRIIVAVSLSAMFAAALPGLVGLVIPVVAGMHIGYRQAKAGRALRTSGIAHLAASGPIGVVRSGSLVALRPQKWRLPPNVGDRSQNVA